MNNKIAVTLGTRPEIIKLSPVIKYCRQKGIPFFIIHTNQHNTYIMDRVFFKELGLPAPKYRLSFALRAYNRHGLFTGKAMQEIEEILLKERPRYVLVQGDTNTTLAASLVAAKLPGIKLAHIEAGLRSYDRNMPEEINRVIVDHLSDYLFAPTQVSKSNLLKEGVPPQKIFVTGNTIADVLKENIKHAEAGTRILEALKLRRGGYGLLTLHRPENVDDGKRFTAIFSGLGKFCRRSGLAIIFSVHPRTRQRMAEFKIKVPGEVRSVNPLGMRDFFELERNARIIFTDSGGLQDESCILKIPCVTLRDNTERPETVAVGANAIAGAAPESIFKNAVKMLEAKRDWKQPFGRGDSAERIIKILLKKQ
jgi:UDP-N-acetylglucosamine 2-epimerase (non-hydrolysing)